MMMIVRTSWLETKASPWPSMSQECKYMVEEHIIKDILIKEFNNTSEGMLELAKVTWCRPTLGTGTLKE